MLATRSTWSRFEKGHLCGWNSARVTWMWAAVSVLQLQTLYCTCTLHSAFLLSCLGVFCCTKAEWTLSLFYSEVFWKHSGQFIRPTVSEYNTTVVNTNNEVSQMYCNITTNITLHICLEEKHFLPCDNRSLHKDFTHLRTVTVTDLNLCQNGWLDFTTWLT